MLLLFDIDGTLLVKSDVPHFTAMRSAIATVFGVHPAEADGVEKHGRTDFAIARDVAGAAGIDPARFDEQRRAFAAAWLGAFTSQTPSDLTALASPGIGDALSSLREQEGHHVGLVTGNLRPLAEMKLERAGLARFVDFDAGGYGSDAEAREDLPPLARRRAGRDVPVPRRQTLLIGDTPRDIACARADRLCCIAVATGAYPADALRDADAVVDHASAIPAAVKRVGAAALLN
jgi:phosphoglycolate phosphatase